MNIVFKEYEEKIVIGKRITLQSRNNYEKELQEIKKQIDKANIQVDKKVLFNFEINYKENNIDTFVGYTVDESELEGKEQYYKFATTIGYKTDKIPNLEIITKNKCEKFLVGTGKINEIQNIYQEMVNYSNTNKIQIRGNFIEVYDNNNVEIYVEAYDLNKINEDYIYYLNNYKVSDKIDKKLIGKYQIVEILPEIKYMLNTDKIKNSLNTKYNELILNNDGTTNYKEITWNKEALILDYDNKKIPLPIHMYIINKEIYLNILMNEEYTYYKSQRPMDYIYKKEKK